MINDLLHFVYGVVGVLESVFLSDFLVFEL